MRNENIDVINYTSNIQLFIQRALSPAKVSSIIMHEDEKRAEVYLKPEEVSLAIGKGGLNIKLASMLTEYTIDVYRELGEDAVADEDIYLDEFKDEIDESVHAVANLLPHQLLPLQPVPLPHLHILSCSQILLPQG